MKCFFVDRQHVNKQNEEEKEGTKKLIERKPHSLCQHEKRWNVDCMQSYKVALILLILSEKNIY